jgi:hypothetical protein
MTRRMGEKCPVCPLAPIVQTAFGHFWVLHAIVPIAFRSRWYMVSYSAAANPQHLEERLPVILYDWLVLDRRLRVEKAGFDYCRRVGHRTRDGKGFCL